MTRKKLSAVKSELTPLPAHVVERNKYVWLAGDVMFIDGLPFVVTVSRRIKFITAHYLPTRTSEHLAASLKETIGIYHRGGFRVQVILMDGEFEKIKPLLPNVVVNTTSAGEHVGDVEWHIRTIKERCRGIINPLPFKRMLVWMLVELVHFCVMWWNATTCKTGISNDYSPREIVVRQGLDYKNHCRVPFGVYCEVFEDRDHTNTMASRTRGAVSLGPTGNLQGTYKFLSLTTGQVIKRRQFKELPMPILVIRQLENWESGRTIGKLAFEDRAGQRYLWDAS